MIGLDVLAALLLAQSFEQRGFIENRTVAYPQSSPNDSGALVEEVLFRDEASYKFTPWLTLNGGFDARTDSHRQTARDWALDADDRSNLAALRTIRHRLADAIRVAEQAASGKAISGGLIRERGRLNFAIVVMSGSDLKEVILEPPGAAGRR